MTARTQWGVSLTAGHMATIAGSSTGSSGSSGDGGAATSALLHGPGGIVLDPSGNLYIADGQNNRVQEVAAASGTQWGRSMTAGDVYTVAGNLTSATSPDANGMPAVTTAGYTASLQLPSCASTALAASAATCSQDPGPTPVAPGGAITPPSAPPLGLTDTLFDTDGNKLYTTTGVYEPGATSAAYSQTIYQLYKNNSITTITCTATPPTASLPCATINAAGVVTQLGYDAQGDLASSSTPDGNSGGHLAITTYAYNADGARTSTISPDGNLSGANSGNYTTTTAYNGDGQRTSVTQGGGTGYTDTPRVSYYTYDANGNQATDEDPGGNVTTTAYNADDKATLVTDALGNATLTCYDGDGNAAQTVPASGVAASSLTVASCPTSYPSGYGTRLSPIPPSTPTTLTASTRRRPRQHPQGSPGTRSPPTATTTTTI